MSGQWIQLPIQTPSIVTKTRDNIMSLSENTICRKWVLEDYFIDIQFLLA
jgi:hypothetical protein